MRFFLLLATVLALALSLASAYENDTSLTHVLLQGFDWEVLSDRASHFSRLNSEITKIKSTGFTGVWVPPVSQSVDAQGYLPQEWYKLVGESNLRTLVANLKSNGLMPIADVVLNHRTAPATSSCTGQYTEFKNPDMGPWAVVANDYKCEGEVGMFCQSGCGCNTADTGDNICYAPDLDHANSQVQSASKAFVAWLTSNVGFTAIRWDVAKGFAAKYFGDYILAAGIEFSIGEYWDGNAQSVVNWIDGTGGRSTAFDFPARYTLRDAIKANSYGSLSSLPGVLLYWKQMSVTFIDNHDTVHGGDPFGDASQVVMGMAFILTHPGTPCIFYNHWISHTSIIATLISIRNDHGINANSQVNIAAAQSGLYAAYIDNRVALKLGSNSWSPSSGYVLQASGPNWAVWAQ